MASKEQEHEAMREHEYSEKKKHMAYKMGKAEKHKLRKGGLAGLTGLMNTKHFGAKRRARHQDAQKKARGEDTF